MTHLTLTRHRDRIGVLRALEGIVARMIEERRIRRDIARLESMSDYQLRDIGLTRSNIRAATRYGVTRS